MKNYFYTTITVFILFMAISCENNALEDVTPGEFICTTDVSYANDINPLLT